MIWTRGARLSAATILAFLLLASVSLVWMAAIQQDMQKDLAESNLWAAAQAERESLRYLQVHRPAHDTDPGSSLQFDILFSRIALLTENPQRAFFELIGQGSALDEALSLVREIDELLRADAQTAAESDPFAGLALAERLADVTHGITLATYLAERRTRAILHDRARRVTNLLSISVIGGFAAGLVMATLLIRRTRKLALLGDELAQHQVILERTIAERTDKLQDALQAERRAKEVYRSFVVTVAHQFRTSLSIIHITAQRQIRRPEGEIGREMRTRFSKIFDAAERLERLIGGFLETAAVQGRDIGGNRSLIDFNAVVSVAVAQTRATHPDRRLVCDTAPGTQMINGDAVLLEQVVLIILSNALKYSAATEPVSIVSRRVGATVLCIVSDHGCGIPEDAMDAIFEPYFRAPNAHRFPGVGLGLSLASQFVGLHNGRIDVSSKLGVGTTFSISLPTESESET